MQNSTDKRKHSNLENAEETVLVYRRILMLTFFYIRTTGIEGMRPCMFETPHIPSWLGDNDIAETHECSLETFEDRSHTLEPLVVHLHDSCLQE